MYKVTLTPTYVESSWTKFEDRLTQKFVSNSFSVVLFFFVFFIGAFLTYNSWTGLNLPSWSRLFIAQDRYWASLFLLGGAFLFYGFNSAVQATQLVLGLIVTCSWLFPIEKLEAFRFEAFYPVLFLFACSFLLHFFKNKKLLSFCFCIFLFLLMNFGLYEVAMRTQNGKILQYFSVLHLDLLLLYFIQRIFAGQNLPKIFDLNPLQLYAPLPIPADSKWVSSKSEKRLFFIKGCLQVLWAQVGFFILLNTSHLDFFYKTENPYIHYVFFLVFILSAMKMLTGLLWMYGFKVRPASHFIFLSKSPLEIWQRGSVYMANFAFFNIYLPIWTRVRNYLLPAFVVILFVYLHLFFFHDIFLKMIMKQLLPSLFNSEITIQSVVQPFIWIGIWVTWIAMFYLGTRKVAKYTTADQLGGWALILMTHAGSASIIPLMLFLQNILFKK